MVEEDRGKEIEEMPERQGENLAARQLLDHEVQVKAVSRMREG